MSPEFCEHLQQYQTFYVRADGAYRRFLVLLDRLLAGEATDSLLDELSLAVHDWQRESRQLRKQFLALVRSERVQLPAGEDGQPICPACGVEIPRLEFPEWSPQEDGRWLYRGRELPQLGRQPVKL